MKKNKIIPKRKKRTSALWPERDEDENSYLKIVSFEWLKSKSSNVLKYLKLEEFVNNVIWHQS